MVAKLTLWFVTTWNHETQNAVFGILQPLLRRGLWDLLMDEKSISPVLRFAKRLPMSIGEGEVRCKESQFS